MSMNTVMKTKMTAYLPGAAADIVSLLRGRTPIQENMPEASRLLTILVIS